MKDETCLLLKYYGDYMKRKNNTTQEYIDTTTHNWKTSVVIKPIRGRKKKLTIYTPVEIKDVKLVNDIVIKHVKEDELDSFKFKSERVIKDL